MRPDINHSHSIVKSLRYNEEKVEAKKAECILAANFLKDPDRLTYDDKLQRFQRRMELNEDVSTSYHISLNFHPSDKLSDKTLQDISRIYMKELGFERQPYLVYKHNDAGHPHLHIVTTHVQRNGDPIVMYKMGENQSEKARQLIEQQFNLVPGEKKREPRIPDKRVMLTVTYGEKSTARSISNVVQHVTENYRYASLEELNIILGLYNVEAYRGKENSKLYQNRGLLYRVLDKQGKYIGVPIKASFFDFKPTLSNLEKNFERNLAYKRQPDIMLNTAVAIQWNLRSYPDNLQKFTKGLAQDRVSMKLQHDKKGVLTNVNYINHYTKCVYRGEELEEKCRIGSIRQLIEADKVRQENLARNPGLQQQQHRQRQRDLDQGLEL